MRVDNSPEYSWVAEAEESVSSRAKREGGRYLKSHRAADLLASFKSWATVRRLGRPLSKQDGFTHVDRPAEDPFETPTGTPNMLCCFPLCCFLRIDMCFSFSDGYYIYTEGNHGNPGDVARLLSPTCTLSGPYCFRFWYHMYGVARDMTLRVYVVPDGAAPELVWSRMGHQGDRWLSGEFSVTHKGRVQVKGGGPRGHSQGTPCPSQNLTGGAPSP